MKIHGGDDYQENGISDILGCYHGRFVAIEAKQPGGKASPLQLLFLKDVKKAGGFAAIVENMTELVEFMDNVDRKIKRR